MSEQDDTTDNLDESADTDRVDDTDGAADLGDAGKKALDAMKAKWQKERDERKARDTRIAELEAAATAKADKAGDEKGPDLEAIRAQAVKEARAEALQERVLDRIEARAAKKFEDPEDARLQLARLAKNFIDGDSVDSDAIDEALADLLKKKPHLAATANKRFAGGADGGARKGSSTVSQLTEQDIKKMTPQQIVDARTAGRLDDYMAS